MLASQTAARRNVTRPKKTKDMREAGKATRAGESKVAELRRPWWETAGTCQLSLLLLGVEKCSKNTVLVGRE